MTEAYRKPWRNALWTVPLILVPGLLMGRVSNSGYGNPWFDALVKPEIMPPGWAFGAAWTTLYILLGIALALVIAAAPSRARSVGLALFAVQMLLNYSWSPLFFAAHQIIAALMVIVAILLLTIATMVQFGRVNRLAALLLVPYIAWLSFASILNFLIMRLNPGA